MSAARALMIVLCGMSLSLSGCLERKERITVREDLSAWIACEFTGHIQDVEEGDAMPSKAGGWSAFTEPVEEDQLKLTATLEIPAGAELPATFAAEDDPGALRFPTSLIREERADGIYYHFRRVYLGRDEARYMWLKRAMEQDSRTQELLRADVETLTDGERATLIEHIREIETEKELRYIEAGIAALEGRGQDVGLRIRAAVVQAGEAFDSQAARALLTQPASPQRDEAISAIADRYLQSLREAADHAVRAERLTPAEVLAFRAAEERERRARQVTEDLQDERWEVTVAMPGLIVAHNATRVDNQGATWEFDGQMLMDRDHTLMVTSRIARPAR